MLLSPTIQKTTFLYWEHYAELMRIYGAAKFSQEIYLGKHRYFIRLAEKMIKIDELKNCENKEQKKGSK